MSYIIYRYDNKTKEVRVKKKLTPKQQLDRLLAEQAKLTKSVAGCYGCRECQPSQDRLKVVTSSINNLRR